MSINQTLRSLYESKWTELCANLAPLEGRHYTNPLLLAFDEEQLDQADLKVMIFGQETKGWGDRYGFLKSPANTMDMYDAFYCQNEFYGGYGRSAFWKAFRYYEKHLRKAHPGKSLHFSWNNINKIGKSRGKTGVSPATRAVERTTFSVIADEVKAYAPDIVIFLTGPNRDGDIRHHFRDAEFEMISPGHQARTLAKVSSVQLPERTVRLYHPSYYREFYKVRADALRVVC